MKSNLAVQTIRKPKIKIEYGDDYKFVQDVVPEFSRLGEGFCYFPLQIWILH